MSFAQKSRQLLGECRSKYYPALFPDERERPLSQPPLLLEEYINQYHPAPGTLLLNDPSSSEQRRRSLEIALSEINGLMAGMHYQDQVEDNSAPIPTRLPSPTAYPTELSDDLLQETPAEFATSEEAATTTGDTTTDDSDQPLAPQWAAIRSLRQVSEIQHKQFQALAEQLDDPIVSKLLDTYPTARDIRNQGAQLVKDVLDGFRPHELSHIFAFTSFSYSVSILLHSKRLLANADILADIRTWRGLIADTKEKQSFDRIAAGLWPEARAHLDPVEASVPSFRDSILSPEHPSLTGSTNFPASRLPFPQTTTTTAGSLPSLDLYDLGIDRGPIDLMNTVHDAFHLSSFDFLGNDFNYQLPANTAWSQRSSPDVPFQVGLGAPQRSPTPFGSPTQARKQPPQPTSEFTEHPKLEQTVMFLVIFAFFQEVGQLLHILSGRSLASRRYKLYPAQKGGQKAFYRHSQDAFFKPCSERLTPGPPAFQALLSVAESFTKQGYLRSIDDIEHYLAGLAAVCFSRRTPHCPRCPLR